MKEIWKPIPQSEYLVSSYGRVKRATVHRNSRHPNALVRPMINSRGYAQVTIHGRSRMVHRLVSEAFIGPRPVDAQTNHIDGRKPNNEAKNLEYVSAKQNARHAIRLGLKPRGSRHYAAQLTENEVREIRRRYTRYQGGVLAREFGVSVNTVAQIVHRRSWKHL